jgi:hypothetical protein
MQAIEAALKDRNQFFLLDQDPGDLTAAYWALRQAFRVGSARRRARAAIVARARNFRCSCEGARTI